MLKCINRLGIGIPCIMTAVGFEKIETCESVSEKLCSTYRAIMHIIFYNIYIIHSTYQYYHIYVVYMVY